MDLATSEGAQARYTRVCVEVDLTKPLLGKYMIGDCVLLFSTWNTNAWRTCMRHMPYRCLNHGT
ncbi:hypothetical protein LINPERPRIM_LOCUS33532 [Linum perenne]